MMVLLAAAVLIVAVPLGAVALLRLIVMLSFLSKVVSPTICSVIVFSSSPAAKLIVPLSPAAPLLPPMLL